MNNITSLLNIKYPIIQGGMVWCSGWELASSVSNCGGLGLIGAGSMDKDMLLHHILKTKENTKLPFGVNLPLIKKGVDEIIEIIIDQKVPIVFTSAGNPAKWTQKFHDNGIKVVHVIANSRGAEKCMEAKVDAVVAEGFEAGGHNGKEETTTLALIPMIKNIVNTPLIAAGGIASGNAMLSAMALGADGVQIGSLFAVSNESSAHINFKNRICEIKEGETRLVLKRLIPVRLAFNGFFREITEAESKGASNEELLNILGVGSAKKAIFDGEIEDGEVEIGQISSMINNIKPVSEIFKNLLTEFNAGIKEIQSGNSKYIF